MGDNPKEEILLPPQFSYLEFGDAIFAQLKGAREFKEVDGSEWVEFTIQPSELLRKRYEIRDNQLDNNQNVTIKVRKEDTIWLNIYDDTNRICLYTKNYNGEETELSDHFWEIIKKYNGERNKRVVIEAELIYLSEQLMLLKSNPTEYITGTLETIDKIMNSAGGLLNRKQEKQE